MNRKETVVFIIGSIVVLTCGIVIGWLQRDITAMEREAKFCTGDHQCPNALEAQKRMRSYQLDLYNDSTVLFDGDRRVGALPAFDSAQKLDLMIYADNE